MISNKRYDLLAGLNESKDSIELPSDIKYQQYTVEIEKQSYEVYIPLRECDAFETKLHKSMQEDSITKLDDFKSLMRLSRGVWR